MYGNNPYGGYPPPQQPPGGYPPPQYQQPGGYPGYPQNPSYPPYPQGQGGYPGASPYPQSSGPYPPQPGGNYPQAPTSSYPYPGGNTSQYPPQQTGSPYPPSTGGSPYPPTGSPYPPAGGTPYGAQPPAYTPQGGSPYQQPPSSSPYPPAGAPYQQQQQQGSYPGAYPPQQQGGSPYHAPHQQQQQNFPTSAYNTPSPHSRQPIMAVQYQGTVREFQPFDPNGDATVLRKAMKGFGTDEGAIMNVLARRTNEQRLRIMISFKTQYGKDLIHDLKSELSGRFEDVIMALMTPTYEYLAKELHDAISGIGTNEGVLIEIMCTATNDQMMQMNAHYVRMYGHSLEQDIRGDTSGHFRRLLTSLCMGNRDESTSVDSAAVASDSQALYNAGEGQWGTDESVFNCMLVSRSYAHLSEVFKQYQSTSGRTMEAVIKREFSGDIERGLLALAKCVIDRPSFYAERLHDSMAGFGTKDSTLIRVVVTRCEIDMVQIKSAYQGIYGKSLEAAIADDTTGDYETFLVALVTED